MEVVLAAHEAMDVRDMPFPEGSVRLAARTAWIRRIIGQLPFLASRRPGTVVWVLPGANCIAGECPASAL
jgi:hypothetical protein